MPRSASPNDPAGPESPAEAAEDHAELDRRLRESESRYRALLEASPDIVFTVDADGRFTYLSESVERLLGQRPQDVVGRHFGAIVDAGSMGAANERWGELRARPGVVLSARFDLIHADGRRLPFEIRSSGLAVDGVFTGVAGAARDISERERLESELRESEARYRDLVQTSPDVVWAVDADGRFTYLSDRLEELTGFLPHEMVGRHFTEAIGPASLDPAVEVWASVQRAPADVHPLSILVGTRDGRSVPVEVWVTGVVRDGRFAGAHGSIRDRREQERLERELRASEAKYRYLVDNSPDIVWSADADGRFTYMSDTSEGVLGWRPDEMVGRHFSTVIHPDSLEFVSREYQASLDGAAAHELRYRFIGLHRDGSRVPLEMHARTMVEDGRYLGAHGAVRDVRDRERLERDLRRQAAALAANDERAHLARELHDSVTQAHFSMTLVTRTIEVLLGRDLDAAAAKLATLRDLQRDALAEMRALIFELRPASLETDGLGAALRTHAAAVQGRTGLAVAVDAEGLERLPAEVEAGLFRIAQEGLNNVVKHASASVATVRVERAAGSVRLAVEDDGRGFDPTAVPGGHLGLAGMRARAEKLGGRFDVESERGRGTRLLAEVPAGTPLGIDVAPARPTAGGPAASIAHERG